MSIHTTISPGGRWRAVALLLPAILCFAGCDKQNGEGHDGYVTARFLNVASPVAGFLESLPVERGDRIARGGVLFRLDPQPESAAMAQAAAQLESARATLADLKTGARTEEIEVLNHLESAMKAASTYANLELARSTELYKTRVVSEEQLNLNQAAWQFTDELVKTVGSLSSYLKLASREGRILSAAADAEASARAFEQAAWRLAQKVRAAPEDAIVFDTLYLPGEWVPEGSPVVSLLPPEEIRIRVYLPQREVARLNIGDSIGIESAAGVRCKGTVRYISPEAAYAPPVLYSRESAEDLVFLTEIDPEPDARKALKPGQPARVFFSGVE